jgi:glycosyltransferase involved in cell wall biosynthesis
MRGLFERSLQLQGIQLWTGAGLIDVEKYHPMDKRTLRIQWGIHEHKRFVISFGAQSLTDERKGFSYLLEALSILHQQLTEEQRSEVLLLIAGKDVNEIKDCLCFDYIHVGYLPQGKLPEFYNAADIFVCPSVNDAGPTMVGQAISCGVPVVAFEMGAALELVKGKDTGYCAPLCDSTALAGCMKRMMMLSPEEYQAMSARCRELVVNEHTMAAAVRIFNQTLNDWESHYKSM